MKVSEKCIFLFIIGGIGYGLLEIGFRGFTHWSMVITGGSALISLYLINHTFPNASIISKAFAGCAVITLLEFTVGLIVNKIYSFGVWDYTNSPANIMGIISLKFSLCWFAISFFMIAVFITLRRIIYSQKS
ncbi:MAG: hypothetical protein IJA80_08435 [Clostridia bacterium]|nr:hypothetical protein [Clostridia bacterium]